ncbi:MAG: DMT family transporter [Alphaproteobacteria bacterium]
MNPLAAFEALPAASRGIALMFLSAMCYAFTYVTIRHLGETFSVYQLVLFRTALGTAVMLPWALRTGGSRLRTRRWKAYGLRAVAVYTGNLCWFFALSHITLADATTLSFMAPLFSVLILAVWLREKLDAWRISAILLGLAGGVVIIRPGFAEIHIATIGMVYTAVAYGAAMAWTRSLTQTENHNAVVFYMFAINLPVSAVPAFVHWTTPGWIDLPWIVVFGVLSLYSQTFMTKSLALAEAAVVMPTYYLQLPLVALLGFAMFDQLPDIWLVPGAALIIGGSYLSVRAEARKRKRAEAVPAEADR